MTLNYSKTGNGSPVILLHGIAASNRYWESFVSQLSNKHEVIAPDLLGFGRSPQSSSGYTVETHCQAINDTLNVANTHRPVTLVGHSMGALLALKYALLFPDQVSQLVLVGMPVYRNPKEAKADIIKSNRLPGFVLYGLSSRIICTIWCRYLRPISKRLAPFYLPNLPSHVASDSVYHTWRAYSESLENVVLHQFVETDLARVKVPVTLVYGTRESGIILANLEGMKKGANIQTIMLGGSHNLPLEMPDQVSRLVQ